MSSSISATLPGSRRALCSSSIARFNIERLLSAIGCDKRPEESTCGDSQIIRKPRVAVNEPAYLGIEDRGSRIEDRGSTLVDPRSSILDPQLIIPFADS